MSIVIPFYKTDITKEAIIISVIQQYFFPVLNSSLIVEINDGDNITLLDKENIDEIVRTLYFPSQRDDESEESTNDRKKSLISLFDFTKWAISLPESGFQKLNIIKIENQPKWEDRLWEPLMLKN